MAPTLFNLMQVISTEVYQQFASGEHSSHENKRPRKWIRGRTAKPLVMIWFGEYQGFDENAYGGRCGGPEPYARRDTIDPTEQLTRVLYIGEAQNLKLHDPLSNNQELGNCVFFGCPSRRAVSRPKQTGLFSIHEISR